MFITVLCEVLMHGRHRPHVLRLVAVASAALLLSAPVLASPVLANPVLATPATATGRAAAAAVVDGSARFQVLTPTLIRMEYAGDAAFQDATTFNAVNRNLPAPAYTTAVSSDGFREIRTSSLTLRYKQNSGPFTASNLSVVVTSTGATANPIFPSYCVVSTACEAENALLRKHAGTAVDHTGYVGSGFVAGYESADSGIEQDVSGVPTAGSYRLAVRYANAVGGDGQSTSRTLSTQVNGVAGPRLTFAPTASWDTWAVTSATVSLRAGANTLALVQAEADSGRINVDSIAILPVSSTNYPGAATTLTTTGYGAGPSSTLGGWTRALDNPAAVPVPEHPGILNRGGWYLLDDTRTALLPADHTVTDRPSHGAQPYQDGYFFGYGTDFRGALGDLNALTGPAALLPQSAYGLWYSRYFAYSAADYQALLPKFRSSYVPLDWLVVDTDWKSPSQWNGWNFNTGLLGDPQTFLDWTRAQGLSVSLNVHPSIATNDPKYATANSQAGGLLPDGSGTSAFDWSNPAHLSAYLNLHRPFEQQGVRAWWLDYCTSCGGSLASDEHVAPDNLINMRYADEFTGRGVRGFSFARIGGAEHGGITTSYPLGPWSERRTTMQFTGDTPATWQMLAFETRFTTDEAAAGLSNVSHDVGSFHGGHLADDLYARWVQFGAFQPIDRLHSDHGDRLPWDYTGDAAASAQRFLRLRGALVPYTYTAARQASTTGVPIVRPMYLDYPGSAAAYTATGQYLYGDNLLVAPITSPNDGSGNGSASVWVPPGSWTDWFTGTTYTGPATVTISAPLSRMPVLVKGGGIVPTRTDYVENAGQRPLTQVTLNVAAGADGTSSLYQDAGEGPGYTSGQSTTTALGWQNGARTLTVGAVSGTYPGAPATRSYTLRLSNATAPTAVTVDGVQVPETAWAYNVDRRTVTVTTDALPVNAAHTIGLTGSAAGNPDGGEIIGAGGLCLDVRGGVAAEGQPMQQYACNHTPAQQFTHGSDGTLRVLGRCVAPVGSTVATVSCTGAAGQSWTRQSDGSLTNTPTGQCLQGQGADQAQVAACASTDAQHWRLPPGPIAGPAGFCADIADADPTSGTPTQLYACNSSDAQRFSAPGDRSLRVFGKCLDVRGGLTVNATPVQLFDCNGTTAQQWVTRSDGTIVSQASGRCLDDAGGTQRSGDRLQIYDCNNTAAQKFRLG
ncbi:TIM-barrel domain-containing protein [Winogradskya humida]|uniref:CBM6 domain-containing protein n=1 Tax=Winogradskya humida TaxID=113566 RepID=A0ABQ4A1M6_9ACTN|nr:TIM-barrel domain-containing protein [Actinoplanes humidus]GIE24518.1 hypothetical protein Ahu01nite_076200 [Actinoplanes humidus]